MTAFRLRRSFVCGAALAALVVLAGAPALADPRLSQVSGTVEIGRGEPPAWSAAAAGDVVGPGDRVRTGRGGRAEIELGSGVVRLYEHSLLRLPADAMRPDGAAAAEVEHGSSLFDVRPRRPSDPFQVRTPEVVASVKGTRFGVQCGSRAAAVSVYAGLVGVRSVTAAPGAETLVRPGFAAVGGPERALELGLLRHDDPWNGWSGGAAAPATPEPLGAPADGDAAKAAGSEDAAIAHAREAAQQAAAPEVLAAVAERRPELVRDARAADAARTDDTDSRHSAPAAMSDDVVREVEVASPARSNAVADRNAVENLERHDDDSATRKIQERAAESLLNGTAPSAGGGSGGGSATGGVSALGLTLQFVKSGGPNRVVISGPTGVPLSAITQGQLDYLRQSGNATILGPLLLAVLQSHGVDPLVFAQQLAPLFR